MRVQLPFVVWSYSYLVILLAFCSCLPCSFFSFSGVPFLLAFLSNKPMVHRSLACIDSWDANTSFGWVTKCTRNCGYLETVWGGLCRIICIYLPIIIISYYSLDETSPMFFSINHNNIFVIRVKPIYKEHCPLFPFKMTLYKITSQWYTPTYSYPCTSWLMPKITP